MREQKMKHLLLLKKHAQLDLKLLPQPVASICLGVQQRECSGLLVENGGVQAFSRYHAKCMLHRHGYKPLGATTDRTMTDQAVLACGRSFFASLTEFGKTHNVVPKNVYNFDEFFVLTHSEDSHFQTSQTFNQFYHQAHHIALQRAECTRKTFSFYSDAAPQHKVRSVELIPPP